MIDEKKAAELRKDFPLLRDSTVAYLDNAATAQRAQCVMDAVERFYRTANANPYRGVYALSEEATEAHEHARRTVAGFINASRPEEVIFTRNATEALNLAAYSLGELLLRPGDEVLVTVFEHHSNILPWQQAVRHAGAKLRYIECEQDGTVTEEAFRSALTPRTKIVSMAQVSNVLGRLYDVGKFARIAHENGSVFVCDGAQSVPHIPVDVQALDVDFLAFSGHKMYAPMGIGVLYGKMQYLEKMPPFMTGGEMIEYVRRDSATFAEVPHKFEAGTVNVGGAVGLEAAIEYIRSVGMEDIRQREEMLTAYAMEKLKAVKGVHIIGSDNPAEHIGIVTFTLDGVHPHDVASILDADGIAVRAGHHCAQPLMAFIKNADGSPVSATVRASFAFYNTKEEIDRLAASLSKIRREMGYAD
ncbi:MAG: cysteine desulfurase [Candidatus Methanomethylophilus sp.]|jgi:cysteine desulfurase/selenocysteine lyase|nr:cysteine desulfurase [Methanomethylophilus sp.]MCI2074480.1 cysteine desulfurase [Methanomethylophilus sp.]MCI2093879.1 cysteine desulfurase [Methanomethylophilus sp.]